MEKSLINVADLRALIEENIDVEAIASEIDGVEGYLLNLNTIDKKMVLSTYLSTKPRLFKRSDALLKEARELGLTSVKFEFLTKSA